MCLSRDKVKALLNFENLESLSSNVNLNAFENIYFVLLDFHLYLRFSLIIMWVVSPVVWVENQLKESYCPVESVPSLIYSKLLFYH